MPSDTDIERAVEQAMRRIFGEGEENQRFVNVSRIPLICNSIISIDKRLDNINDKLDQKFVTKEAFSPVQKIVYGGVGLILTSVVVALLALVITQR